MKQNHARTVLSRLMFAALVVFTLSSCGLLFGPDEGDAPRGVSGTVRYLSNAAAEGVRVFLLPVHDDWASVGQAVAVLSEDLRRVVLTDSDGTYALPAPEHGLYRVVAELEGYYVFPESGSTLTAGRSDTVTQNFRMLDLSREITPIADIQGLQHQSTMEGETVDSVLGVVTTVDRDLGLPWISPRMQAVYLQDPNPDGRFSSSDAIKVLMPESDTVEAGQVITVADALVVEDTRDPPFYDSVWSSATLSRTQLRVDATHQIRVWYRPIAGRPYVAPEPVIIGASGLRPPVVQSYQGLPGRSLWHEDVFIQPARRAADFYEALEHMVVAVEDAEVSGASDRFSRFFVTPDGGRNGSDRRAVGGARTAGYARLDPMIEIYPVNQALMPDLRVGTRFEDELVGVLSFHRARFSILSETAHTRSYRVPRVPRAEVSAPDSGAFDVASLNVQNLSAADTSTARVSALADTVVDGLASPAILVLLEVLDDRGSTSGSDPDASDTLALLRDAIVSGGGPSYDWTQIDPEPFADGGVANGNPRAVIFYDPLRTSAVYAGAAAAADASTPAEAERTIADDGREVLVRNLPSRVLAAGTEIFDDSRKPLVAAFSFDDNTLYIVGVHFTSKFGDTPVYGRIQPPDRSGSEEARRHPQAQAVAALVSEMLSLDPDARIIVAGDVNDFEFSETAAILEQAGLVNPASTLPAEHRYTYVFNGYGQMLDHLFASNGIIQTYSPDFAVVHRHSAFAESDVRRASDHEPVHMRLHPK
ncbi:MAG: hypothetical protein ACOC4F_00370 [bacterium]